MVHQMILPLRTAIYFTAGYKYTKKRSTKLISIEIKADGCSVFLTHFNLVLLSSSQNQSRVDIDRTPSKYYPTTLVNRTFINSLMIFL